MPSEYYRGKWMKRQLFKYRCRVLIGDTIAAIGILFLLFFLRF